MTGSSFTNDDVGKSMVERNETTGGLTHYDRDIEAFMHEMFCHTRVALAKYERVELDGRRERLTGQKHAAVEGIVARQKNIANLLECVRIMARNFGIDVPPWVDEVDKEMVKGSLKRDQKRF